MRFPFPLLPSSVRWLGVGTVVLLLLYFSLLSAPPAAPPDEGLAAFWDKKLHFLGYLALGLSLAYATATSPRTNRTRVLVVVGAAIVFGVGIEILQGPLPDRYFSFVDMLANAVGALLAAGWFALEPLLEYVPIPSRGEGTA